MDEFSTWVEIKVKPGNENRLGHLLRSSLRVAEAETGTTHFFVLRLDEQTFAIFDTFADGAARDAHINGEIPKTLLNEDVMALLDGPPVLKPGRVLGAKSQQSISAASA